MVNVAFAYEAFTAVVLAFLFDNTLDKKDSQIRKYIGKHWLGNYVQLFL